MYKVIATGSKGNAVIYHDMVMVDCGCPFNKIEKYLHSIQLILLTHEHLDHINIVTLKKMQKERPLLRIGCCEWMAKHLEGFKNIDIYGIGESYKYGMFTISPFKLYHDVKNCGYRILTDNYKIFHATDTAHLEGIKAVDYDLYAIEHNYCEEAIKMIIKEKTENNIFCYEKGAEKSHLSEQQAIDFIFANTTKESEVLRLHESSRNL